jgi:hypothetical protein
MGTCTVLTGTAGRGTGHSAITGITVPIGAAGPGTGHTAFTVTRAGLIGAGTAIGIDVTGAGGNSQRS